MSSRVCSILVQNVAAALVVDEEVDTAVVVVEEEEEEEDMGVAGEEAIVAGDMGQSIS